MMQMQQCSPIASTTASATRPQRRYVLTQTLGTGTYGQVYLCYDPQCPEMQMNMKKGMLGQSYGGCYSPNVRSQVSMHNVPMYAVKVANKEAAYRRSALSESKVLQLLIDNRETVNWVDTYEESGRICIVTELLAKTIYELMKASAFKPIPLSELRMIGGNVLKSLAALHSLGYMHCDVKPENVMVRSLTEGATSACLIDFGAVRQLAENAYFDIQSLWYRAPEVLCSVPYTPKIDAWSSGCLLYELATGRALFPATSTTDALTRIVEMMGSPSQEACQRNTQGVRVTYNPGPTRRASRYITDEIIKIHGDTHEARGLIDLLFHLLCPDESVRWSCADALKHDFFEAENGRTPETANKASIDEDALERSNSCEQLEVDFTLLPNTASINRKETYDAPFAASSNTSMVRANSNMGASLNFNNSHRSASTLLPSRLLGMQGSYASLDNSTGNFSNSTFEQSPAQITQSAGNSAVAAGGSTTYTSGGGSIGLPSLRSGRWGQ